MAQWWEESHRTQSVKALACWFQAAEVELPLFEPYAGYWWRSTKKGDLWANCFNVAHLIRLRQGKFQISSKPTFIPNGFWQSHGLFDSIADALLCVWPADQAIPKWRPVK